MLATLNPVLLVALAMALFGAAYVRGYSGFGFSALFLAFAALFTNPVPLIPVVYICELIMTGFQARGIRPHIDWKRVAWLALGASLILPIAVFAISSASEETARLAVSLAILVLSLILLTGRSFRGTINGPGHSAVGAISGLCNGAGVGGLPVVAFLTAQPIAPSTFRATMIAYLTILDIMTLPMMYLAGMISIHTFTTAAVALPILGMGLWLGSQKFLRASPAGFRRLAIILLLGLSGSGIVRAFLS